eukprot:11313448-Ditylum_brightwellii.AAC.1
MRSSTAVASVVGREGNKKPDKPSNTASTSRPAKARASTMLRMAGVMMGDGRPRRAAQSSQASCKTPRC